MKRTSDQHDAILSSYLSWQAGLIGLITLGSAWRKILSFALWTCIAIPGYFPSTDHLLAGVTKSLFSYYGSLYADDILPKETLFPGEYFSIPELYNCTKETFAIASDGMRRPVLCKGLMSNTRAQELWSIDYLGRNFPDIQAMFTFQTSSKVHSRDQKAANEIFLGDQIKEINESRAHRKSITFEDRFAQNLTSDLKTHDISFGLYEPSNIRAHTMIVQRAHVGSSSVVANSSWHSQPDSVAVFQVKGTKRWTVIDPKYNLLMDGMYLGDDLPVLLHNMNPPPANWDRIPKYQVVAEPGDVLYCPSWWWHYVETLAVDTDQDPEVLSLFTSHLFIGNLITRYLDTTLVSLGKSIDMMASSTGYYFISGPLKGIF